MPIPQRRPIRHLVLVLLGALLAACQSMPTPKGFNAEQIAVLKAEGFVEAADDDWALTLNERTLFDVNESALKPDQIERLSILAQHLVAVDITTARVEGHTDSTGTETYNQTLSEARAQTVAIPLQANGMRFTPDQIVGRGETIPLSPNTTPEGRQDNRRVVVIVSPPE